MNDEFSRDSDNSFSTSTDNKFVEGGIGKNDNLDGQLEEKQKETIKKEDICHKEKLEKILQVNNKKFIECFELKEVIGSGSESYVYRAIIRKNKRNIACKIIKKRRNEKINEKEIKIGMKLKNKNINHILGASPLIKNELYFVAMDLDKFGNIRNFQNSLKRNILSEQLLCYISNHILNGLNYLHRCKIAHFDIKPQNITVDELLNFKIIDFSVSYDYSKEKSQTIKLPFKGTDFYMAPEVIKGETIEVKDLNKVDLYSFGVTLYNLAYGEYPYGLTGEHSRNYYKIYSKIQENWEIKNDCNNSLSKDFIDFLKKILEKDINKRINIHQALNHHWVQGAKILLNEKEIIYNSNAFLIYLITDYFKSFNDYVKSKD